ncbi:MAG: ATP-dependent DNA helicase RecG [Patescibacteria group bacterium]|nr:ATP-dependent DNA helicase RecG [Patescibacteria group bacterium]
MQISTLVGEVPKIGPIYIKRLNKIGVKTIYDLFFHFPHKYDDFSNLKKISKAKIHEPVCIKGEIVLIENQVTFRKRFSITKAVIKDNTGTMQATWFNQPYLTQSLKQGDTVCFAGKISVGKDGLYMSNPIYEKTWPGHNLVHTNRIVPAYPETKGLSSKWLRFIIKPLLEEFKNQIPESLPKELIKDNNLLSIRKAIWEIHFPSSVKMMEKAKERFAFEELFILELFVLNKKQELSQLETIPIPINLETIKRFAKSLPFKLTDAQRKSSWQILKDTERDQPMTRLLQGDVGSGKTAVATLAALNTIKSGSQVAFMAPTEILSRQHFQTLANLLKDFNINIGLLTSKTDKFVSKKLKRQTIEISRTKLIEKTLEGEINILIGTHSLIQDKVKFQKLGLVIVDEQHRFGVKQRAKLCQKKNGKSKKILIPHLLSMTATPIPRSLALTVYGDLDLSLIDEMPKGKRKVKTLIVPQKDRKKTYEVIKKEIKKGKQIFIICPRIEEKEIEDGKEDKTGWSDVKAVKEEYKRLSEKIFPKFKLAMLHGKMPITEKAQIMKKFKNGKIDILVSTSVIEVGIDIPNATVMLIEGAERFGLSQLHQFRGRIGRTGEQSYCFLFYNSRSKNAIARLKALSKIENGLELAEKDLKIRGPGQFLGTKQWGIPDIAMNALNDFSLVETTREAAKKILSSDPKLKNLPALKKRLSKFTKTIHLE